MSWLATQEPFYNPPVPFTGAIHGGLFDGKMVAVQGQVHSYCDRFVVNFQCGTSVNPRSDIAFHFNPRFDENCVVCNTLQHQNWGSEERKYEVPFILGQRFEILFLTRASSFMVAVNGSHFLEYKHRIPLSRVDTIHVSGQIQLSLISFQDTRVSPAFPSSGAAISASFALPSCYAAPTTCAVFPPSYGISSYPSAPTNFKVPYEAHIPNGMYPPRAITVSGSVPNHADSFRIDLKKNSNIAFHLAVRFGENALVRNSFLNNVWGSEERSLPNGRMPISRGQSFTISIVCEHHGFKVSVNGQMFDFRHRESNLHLINKIEIGGDVQLTSVYF
ncbi:galectin-9B-like [Protopterus annectens]|uniref:galectin-9B-like n=1 Tax=Protopterus annectens TaxID=7888 RepID=UPI001CFAF20D|nr:galectin-9B-like [Protopterus annectens]